MEALYKNYSTITYDEKGLPTSFSLHCPDDFNFAYDVVDRIAAEEPDKRALAWCSSTGEEREFSFGEISRLSTKTANLFKSCGIKKGTKVMLLLKRHYSYW